MVFSLSLVLYATRNFNFKNEPQRVTRVPRRPLLGGAAAAGLLGSPKPSFCAEERASTSRVPSYTMLIPLVELKTTIEAWLAEGNATRVDQGLHVLAKGGIFSAKNFYLGVGGKYLQAIQYDDIDKALVRRERERRFSSLVDVDVAIDTALKRGPRPALDEADNALGKFLALCPTTDVDNARRALRAFQEADKDQDGVVTELEFYAQGGLTDVDRIAATWGVWGGAISDHLRPDYSPGFVDLDLGSSPPPPVPDNYRRDIIAMVF